MPPRKQADHIGPGDRVGLKVLLHFDVLSSDAKDGWVVLEVTPARCVDENCPNGCDCHYSMFDGQTGPFKIRVDAKQRLAFAGNLDELEAQMKLMAEQRRRLRPSRNGNSSADVGSAEPSNGGV